VLKVGISRYEDGVEWRAWALWRVRRVACASWRMRARLLRMRWPQCTSGALPQLQLEWFYDTCELRECDGADGT